MHFTLISFLIFVSTQTLQAAIPTSLEFYGDSLTAGMLADRPLTASASLGDVARILSDFATYKITSNYKYIEKYERKDLTWAQYLTSSLNEQAGHSISVQNFAVSGAKTSDIADQISTGSVPEPKSWSFFWIGHNDICKAPDLESFSKAFEQNLVSTFEKWDATHREATAYVLPMGDIPRVFETLKGYTWHDEARRKFRCEESWTVLFPYCPRYARLLHEGKLHEEVSPYISRANALLHDVSTKMVSKNHNRMQYLSVDERFQYRPEYFAIDCFHLSATGEKLVADTVLSTL